MHLLLPLIVINLLFILSTIILSRPWHHHNSLLNWMIICFRSSFDILHRILCIAYFMLVIWVKHRLVVLICYWCSVGSNYSLIFRLWVICIVVSGVATGWAVKCLILLFNLQLHHVLRFLVPLLRILLCTLWFLLANKGLHVLFDIFLQIVMRTNHLGHRIWFQWYRFLLAFDWRLYFLRIPYYCQIPVQRCEICLAICKRGSIIGIIMNWDV